MPQIPTALLGGWYYFCYLLRPFGIVMVATPVVSFWVALDYVKPVLEPNQLIKE